jgi:hypothetical protein
LERSTADTGAEEIQDRILEELILEELDERPPRAWTEINREVVERSPKRRRLHKTSWRLRFGKRRCRDASPRPPS